MFGKKEHRSVPELNTTSTADISFMLLVFFLVTTSMDTDMGLPRQMAPIQKEQKLERREVTKRNVMEISVNADNTITCNGETVNSSQLRSRIIDFVENIDNSPDKAEKTVVMLPIFGKVPVANKHVLCIIAHPESSYNTYFLMQEAIIGAYHDLRDRCARQTFGCSLADCTREELEALALRYPQRISESSKGGLK